MKKLLALLVALICALAITVTACSDGDVDTGKENDKNEQIDDNKEDGKEEEGDKEGNKEENTEHECEYELEWTAGESTHWHASTCTRHPNNKSEEEPHEFTSITGTCTVCDAPTPSRFFEGDKLPYFSFNTYANTSATYSTQSAEGKVLVINFWFQTCHPCVEEMPEFEKISQKYGDDIAIVALHSHNGQQTSAESFIRSSGWADYKMTFGLDESNAIYNKLGGYGEYPLTIVVDTEGVIVEIIDGQVIRQEGLENPPVIVDYITPAIEKALGR